MTNYVSAVPLKELGLGLGIEHLGDEQAQELTDDYSLPALKVKWSRRLNLDVLVMTGAVFMNGGRNEGCCCFSCRCSSSCGWDKALNVSVDWLFFCHLRE